MEYLILGITLGGIYALIAVGYTMVYGIIKLINFAHGEIFMFGAYFAFTLISSSSQSFAIGSTIVVFLSFFIVAYNFIKDKRGVVLSLLVSFPFSIVIALMSYKLFLLPVNFFFAVLISMIFSAILGMSVDILAYRPIRKAPRLTALITAIGMSFFLQNLAMIIWEARVRNFPDSAVPSIFKTPIEVNGQFFSEELRASMGFWELLKKGHLVRIGENTTVSLLAILIILITVVGMIILQLIIYKTKLGKSMRACAQDKVTAALMGINVNRTIAMTFMIGSIFACVGAILFVLYSKQLKPTMGYKVGIIAFSAAVLGGIGNVPGAMLGGLLMGIAVNMATAIPGVGSRWADGCGYLLMILVIIFRPTGILGTKSIDRA